MRLALYLIFIFILLACGQDKQQAQSATSAADIEGETQQQEIEKEEGKIIRLREVSGTCKTNLSINYVLRGQAVYPENSDNNAPYACLMNNAQASVGKALSLLRGNNVLLSFPVCENGISDKQSYFFRNFIQGPDIGSFDTSAMHLFYYLPAEGSVHKSGTVLLDFYLLNGKLSDNAYRVRMRVDETEFILSAWRAYQLEGLEEGEHSIRLELIDASGQLVPGPFNDSGERKIWVQQAAA